MVTTSIVIPNYNGGQMLRECIHSIQTHTHLPHEIILVDNGSTDNSVPFCLKKKIRVVRLPKKTGFPVACNTGMKIASGESILLLNNDTLVTKGWLERMLSCLNHDPRTGIVGPMSNYANGAQQISEPFTNLEEIEAKMKGPDPVKWKEVNRIVGLCMLIKREVVEKIGLLDERFSPGHYEDDDYCYRALLAGFKLKIAGDAFVFHHGSASFKKYGEKYIHQLLERNRRLFIEKWMVDPAVLTQKGPLFQQNQKEGEKPHIENSLSPGELKEEIFQPSLRMNHPDEQ